MYRVATARCIPFQEHKDTHFELFWVNNVLRAEIKAAYLVVPLSRLQKREVIDRV